MFDCGFSLQLVPIRRDMSKTCLMVAKHLDLHFAFHIVQKESHRRIRSNHEAIGTDQKSYYEPKTGDNACRSAAGILAMS